MAFFHRKQFSKEKKIVTSMKNIIAVLFALSASMTLATIIKRRSLVLITKEKLMFFPRSGVFIISYLAE